MGSNLWGTDSFEQAVPNTPYEGNKYNLHRVYTAYSVVSEEIKPLELAGQAAELQFEQKLEQVQARRLIGNHL